MNSKWLKRLSLVLVLAGCGAVAGCRAMTMVADTTEKVGPTILGAALLVATFAVESKRDPSDEFREEQARREYDYWNEQYPEIIPPN